jgi:acetyltransferase-like isoleucine patch superfamily enzyme
MTKKGTFILGSGGHAHSLVANFLDPEITYTFVGPDCSVSDEDFMKNYSPLECRVYNGLGVKGHDHRDRIEIFRKFSAEGYILDNLVSPSAILHSPINGVDIQIFSLVYVGPSTLISSNSVLNTGAIVEHNVTIDESVFIAPGVVICGDVRIGKNVFIGAGSLILPGVRIPDNAIIKSGKRVSVNSII